MKAPIEWQWVIYTVIYLLNPEYLNPETIIEFFLLFLEHSFTF